jgi:hypothetical protein
MSAGMTDLGPIEPPAGTRSTDRPAGIAARAAAVCRAWWPVVAGVTSGIAAAGAFVYGCGEAKAGTAARFGAIEFRLSTHDTAISEFRQTQLDVAYLRGGIGQAFTEKQKAAADQAETEAKSRQSAARIRPLPGAP